MSQTPKQSREPRKNISISPISGLQTYLYSPNCATPLIRCVVWNLSTGGACLLLNGVHEKFNHGDIVALNFSAPFDSENHTWECSIRWVSIEVFVTFIGVSFVEVDNTRNDYFLPFFQDK